MGETNAAASRRPRQAGSRPGYRIHCVNDLIDSIYEGPLEKDCWSSFLDRLSKETGSVAALVLKWPSDGHIGRIIRSGGAEEVYRQFQDEYSDSSPFLNIPLGRVHWLREMASESDILSKPYFMNYLKRHGVVDILALDLKPESGIFGRLRLVRHSPHPMFDHTTTQLLRELQPHLERSFRLGGEIARAASERDAVGQAFDQTGVSMVLLDRNGTILSYNQAARQLLQEQPWMFSQTRQLQFSDTKITKALVELARSTFSNPEDIKTSSQKFRIKKDDAKGVETLFSINASVVRSDMDSGDTISPAVVVVIREGQAIHRVNADWLSVMLNLTLAEARIGLSIARGLSIEEIAEEQKVARTTVRTHLYTVFSKVHVHSQAQLVSLIHDAITCFETY